MAKTKPIPSGEGAYGKATHGEIHGTLALFQYIHAFLASDKKLVSAKNITNRWTDTGETWDKTRTQRELHSMIHTAINRKSGYDPNHYDVRRSGWNYWNIKQLQYRLNTPRVIVRAHEVPSKYWNKISSNHLTQPEDECY